MKSSNKFYYYYIVAQYYNENGYSVSTYSIKYHKEINDIQDIISIAEDLKNNYNLFSVPIIIFYKLLRIE